MEVVISTTPDESAKLAADAIAELVGRRPEAVLGVATGSSPLMIYDELGRRVAQGHPILAVESEGAVLGVATLTPPGELTGPATPEFEARREALWKDLGEPAKARMEALIAVWERLSVPGPQWHLNMLGVRGSHAGRGLGRSLMDQVHRISKDDPGSSGVSLSTELPSNVPLYQHCGYELRHHERVSDDLETWILFRPDDVP